MACAVWAPKLGTLVSPWMVLAARAAVSAVWKHSSVVGRSSERLRRWRRQPTAIESASWPATVQFTTVSSPQRLLKERSEERRVGEEGVGKCRSGGWRYHE